ncbi:MAG TPA: hypothetical protein VK879_17290 [Candidatus Sulfomarinibacteraceae bacterium]|nr:hypothetical protein [Candidatus Sulfomarinibacteraceae bacterium]
MSEHDQRGGNQGFPYVAVIVSAIILMAIGAVLLNMANAGALPTGLGIGAELPDLVRGVVISVILAVIAVVAYGVLKRES